MYLDFKIYEKSQKETSIQITNLGEYLKKLKMYIFLIWKKLTEITKKYYSHSN